MSYRLNRKEYRHDGIFSEFLTPFGSLIAMTLDHAYLLEGSDPEKYQPKVMPGEYICTRGIHRLPWHEEVMDPILSKIGAKIVFIDGIRLVEFETFEITGPGLVGHKDILFHWGNYNEDSDGCVLTGAQIGNKSNGGKMITSARSTFAYFMSTMSGIDSFPLTVSE